MRVLVLGGYGLIGAVVVDRLLEAGHGVVGLGRDVTAAARRRASVRWLSADIAALREPKAWLPFLDDIEAVVNASGALQDGARDDVAAVQSVAMRALFAACVAHGIRIIVQISAVGAALEAATPFMRTKAEADEALMALDLDWVILRPGLVIAPTAYGGTALLRALAAFPFVVPLLGGDQRVKTVRVEDVADAVAMVLDGKVPVRHSYDLVEDGTHRLADVVLAMRAWLGYPPAPIVRVPALLGRAMFKLGDGLGALGWRTPLRSTARVEVEAGLLGDASAWREATGRPILSLTEALARLPSTAQERWYARAWLVKPIIIAVLALFWCLTGVIALARFPQATELLEGHGVLSLSALVTVLGGALVDIALGSLILVRRFTGVASLGMIAITLAYLLGGTLIAPGLWLDPLGPYLKTLPAAALALVVLALDQER